MLRRLGLLAVVAVLGLGLLAIAGCGGDDKKGATPTPAPPNRTSDEAIGTPTEEQVKAAVGACRQSIASQPQLKPGLTARLERICDRAASQDVAGARKSSLDVCRRIIEELVPTGSARDQALVACEQSAEAP